MAFDLFGGGSSIPKFNTAPLLADVNASAERRKKLVTGLASQLPGVSNIYKQSQTQAGKDFTAANTAAAKTYQANLAGLGTSADQARQEAIRSNTEQAYRNVPQQQESIREALGGTGQLRTGVGRSELAQPLVQASQNVADLTSKLTQQGLNEKEARAEAGVQAVYQSDAGNALTTLGIDQDTARTLLATGRQDLIQQAADLAGIDKDTLNATLGIEIAGQEADIYGAQANAARKGAILKGIGGLGGAAIGGLMGGGLPGATLGANVGSNVGSVIAGIS